MTKSSGSTNNSLEISGLQDISEGQVNLANAEIGQGNTIYSQGQSIYSPAYSQYVSGVTGQLTPAQQALVTQNLGTQNAATASTYGNLGLGGSTMETQGMDSNQLQSEAETANLLAQSETLGLSGLSEARNYDTTAQSYYSGANTGLSGAASSAYEAGLLSDSNLSALNSAIGSLGSKSGSSLSSLLGSAGGASAATSLLSA